MLGLFWMVIRALIAKPLSVLAGGRLWWGGCGWLFVENCTVDASIFVVKLLRADGGCLGTRSR